MCCRGFEGSSDVAAATLGSGASRRGSTDYFFLAFFLRAAFFFFGPFFAAPFEAAALARFRLAFMSINPLCRRNAFDSMKVATESRMEMQFDGVELRIFVTEAVKIESGAVLHVSSLRISRRIGTRKSFATTRRDAQASQMRGSCPTHRSQVRFQLRFGRAIVRRSRCAREMLGAVMRQSPPKVARSPTLRYKAALTRSTAMKDGIHPDYHEITVVMTDGTSYQTRSTYGKAGDTLRLEIDSKSHPAWTGGQQRLLDSGGQLARFNKRFSSFGLKK
jgi:large subunit ribosomal protein L31